MKPSRGYLCAQADRCVPATEHGSVLRERAEEFGILNLCPTVVFQNDQKQRVEPLCAVAHSRSLSGRLTVQDLVNPATLVPSSGLS
jgi:hypothetical protein